MQKNRKHLVRCNARISKRKTVKGVDTWEYDGFIELETNLEISFIMISDESILNDTFKELVEKHNTTNLRYDYIDFELEYNYPIKLKGNPVNEYNKRLKIETENIKNNIYGE